MFQKMDGHVNTFKQTKYMSFEIKKNQLLEKHNETCNIMSNIIEKAFDT